MSPRRYVVVGGGISGLSAAYYLERLSASAGDTAEVILVESSDALGGKVGTEVVDGMLLDTGPDSFMAQKPWAVDLCRELGMGDEVIAPLARKFYILLDGQLHPVPHELVALVPAKPEALWKASFLSVAGKVRASSEALVRPDRDSEDESLSSFMRRRFGDEFALRFAEPLMGGVHAGHPERMSMAATYPMYWRMEKDKGSVTRALMERRLAMGKGSGAAASPFVALRRGMWSLIERLATTLDGTEIQLKTQALALSTHGATTTVSVKGPRGREALAADAVILTTPSFVSAQLLRGLAPAAADQLDAIPYASTAVVSLGYERQDVGDPLDGSGFLAPRSEPSAITGCTWSSNKWEGRSSDGTVLMRAFVGHAGADEVVERSSIDALGQLAHDALAPLLGIRAQPRLIRVHRWLRSMPQYEVGHLGRLSSIDAALAGSPGIILCGSAYRGIGMPDCVRQAREAAQRALCVGRDEKEAVP